MLKHGIYSKYTAKFLNIIELNSILLDRFSADKRRCNYLYPFYSSLHHSNRLDFNWIIRQIQVKLKLPWVSSNGKLVLIPSNAYPYTQFISQNKQQGLQPPFSLYAFLFTLLNHTRCQPSIVVVKTRNKCVSFQKKITLLCRTSST